jgi:hypothetical protein
VASAVLNGIGSSGPHGRRRVDRAWVPPVAAFVASRVLLVVASSLCLELFPTHTILPWQADAFPGKAWLNGWVRWDAMWYESLVDATARWLPPKHSGANFFPLYSWAGWVASLPLRPWLPMDAAFYLGALAVSHAAFLMGLAGIYRLTRGRAGTEVAERVMWLMAFFPFSFFFGAVYSDALYLSLAAWCFLFAQSRRWRLAASCAALGALTRVTGVALILALVTEYLAQHRFRFRSLRHELGAGAILAAAPLVAAAHFWRRYGTPLAFVYARQTGWHRGIGLGALVGDFREFTAGSLLACGTLQQCLSGWEMTRILLGGWYVALAPATLLLTSSALRAVGPGQTVWVVATVGMALVNGLDGMGRFTAVLFPAFVAAAIQIQSRAGLVAACLLFTPFLLLFTCQFARWRPVL